MTTAKHEVAAGHVRVIKVVERNPAWSLETAPKTVMQITFCPIGFHRDLRARYAKKARTFNERNEF